MDHIRPIGPREHEIDPLERVQRLKDEREQRERDPERREPARPSRQPAADERQEDEKPDGPVEGDDGHMHIDVKA
jgi:hypothetical protein